VIPRRELDELCGEWSLEIGVIEKHYVLGWLLAASKTNTFLGERYRRIARRRGKKKAIVAVGRSILVITWYLLSDPEVCYHDLGSGATTTHASTQDVGSATTSANSKPSATKSLSNPQPDPPKHSTSPLPIPAPLRSAGMLRLPTHHPFSTQILDAHWCRTPRPQPRSRGSWPRRRGGR
jgi:hypothetical protein